MSITAYDTELGPKRVAGHGDDSEQHWGRAMAKEDVHCAQLNQEHTFVYDGVRGMWVCRSCSEAILESLMNKVVEREVSLSSGHVMMLWPAMIEQRRKG